MAEQAGHDAKGPQIPREFGDYELLGEIGRGGQGVVYRARQKSLNRVVALKMLGSGSWASEVHLRRFRREAEAAASLHHPSIVPIHEIGEQDGCCYFSMDLVEGGRLDSEVQEKPLSPHRAAELIAKLARTVHYAHERGILHRDIKPGNILLDEAGELYLTDFGLARLVVSEGDVTATTALLGTPSYMAPEQASDQKTAAITAATDVYALGAVLYYLLTGKPPFAGETVYETVRMVLDAPPPSPRAGNAAVDRELATICLKCLEKEPTRRYGSALELAQDLERWLLREPIHARPIGLAGRSGKWLQRNPAIAFSTASFLGLLIAVGFIVSRSTLFQPPPAAGIAVLPFENLSAKENAYFADGMQDDLITKLAKVTELRVISRTSVMSYRGKPDVRKIGRALNVSRVVEGSVRRDDHRVHVNVQLIDTRNDTHVWGEEYDRDLSGTFALESEITKDIADRLQAKIAPPQLAQIDRKPTSNLQAYNAFLQGQFFGQHRTADDFRKAINYYEDAVRLDPNYALAYADLSIDAANLANNFTNLATKEGRETVAKARAAADRALRLDPNLSEAHIAKGGILRLFDFDFTGAEAQYRIALQLAPQSAAAMEHLATSLSLLGRFDEAATLGERAARLNPLGSGSLVNLSLYLAALGRDAEAETTLRKAIALQPSAGQNYMHLARILILRGKPAAAVEAAKQETDPFFRTYALALAYFADGNRTDADTQLNKLIKEDADDGGSQIASVYALRKEPGQMFKWLEHAWVTHDPGLIELRVDPFLRAYRDDPRFVAFARKIGLGGESRP